MNNQIDSPKYGDVCVDYYTGETEGSLRYIGKSLDRIPEGHMVKAVTEILGIPICLVLYANNQGTKVLVSQVGGNQNDKV